MKAEKMSPECEKFLLYVLENPEMDKPVAIDDAADVLRGIKLSTLFEVCQTNIVNLREKIETELNLMELNELTIGPWILNAFGKQIEGAYVCETKGPYQGKTIKIWEHHVPLPVSDLPMAKPEKTKIDHYANEDDEDEDES